MYEPDVGLSLADIKMVDEFVQHDVSATGMAIHNDTVENKKIHHRMATYIRNANEDH